MHGALVTGTDTGVGKTVVAASIAAALCARGLAVAAVKPVVTGLDEPQEGRPADHELLAAATGTAPSAVAPRTFGPAVSPHLAAQLAGTTLDPSELLSNARANAAGADVVIAEGAGGLLVPLSVGAGATGNGGAPYLLRDYALDLGLPLVVAARPGLGTINHTLLTLEAARAAGLEVLCVVLTPWPQAPSQIEESNRETIAALGEVEVEVLAHVGVEASELSQAGAGLAVTAWLADAAGADGSALAA